MNWALFVIVMGWPVDVPLATFTTFEACKAARLEMRVEGVTMDCLEVM